LEIDGLSLTTADVVAVARERVQVRLADSARRRVERCRAVVDKLVESETKVYGLTTGFGSKRDVFIQRSEVLILQENLIVSHACGVGRPLSEDQARATMLLRAHTLARGVSGVRPELIDAVLAMLNAGIYPYIPCKGSLGASGDLAPLSHLALVIMGHPAGKVYSEKNREVNSRGHQTVEEPWVNLFVPSTSEYLKENFQVDPVVLQAKEGLALNNGTQMMSAIGVLTLHDAERLVQNAEIACAASLESIKGVRDAYDARLQEARPFPGQIASASNLRRLLEGSEILSYEFNMAQLARALRSIDEDMETLSAERNEKVRDALGRVDDCRQILERIRQQPAAVLKSGTESLSEKERSRWTERQLQLRVFRLALAPAQEALQDAYRMLLDMDLDEGGLASREAIMETLNALEKAVPAHPRVQDNYSMRCMPQVAGSVRQGLAHVRTNLEIEINSATDNPLIFPPDPRSEDEPIESYAARLSIPDCVRSVSSGGNFHGEIIALSMDYLAMGIAEIGNISERRTAQMTDGHLNNGLPSLLIWKSGLNSGFMIPQYTAASIVSENKLLTHPASTDSIPSCENTEDHVSMGAIAARKAREILDNVEQLVAIEFLNAHQALCFRAPLKPGVAVSEMIRVLRDAGVTPVEEDRPLYMDMETVCQLVRRGEILMRVEASIGELL
jgi:histidine ammonia-lyase